MPRKKREESPTGIYHWIVRGTNKKNIFHDSRDYLYFKDLVLEYKSRYSIQIYHYCLMTNHTHKLLHADHLKNLAGFSHYVQRRYAYYYCQRYQWAGCVFQKGYKSLIISREEYLLECGRYIERNPVRVGLVRSAEGYEYSSYHYYAEGKEDNLLTASPAYLGLSEDPKQRRRLYARHVSERRIYEEMKEQNLLCS